MEILWWLVPSVVVTVLAMLGVGWLGRANRGAVDRDAAVARMGEALRTRHRGLERRTPPTRRERSTGVAVRRSSQVSRPAADERRSA